MPRPQTFHGFARLACAAALLLAACGDSEESANPEFEDLQILCTSANNLEGVQGQIVKELRVLVTDPDRDLVSVTGTLNAIPMTLEDPDADLYYSWFPDQNDRVIACRGDFHVQLEAVDAAGNVTRFSQVVSK